MRALTVFAVIAGVVLLARHTASHRGWSIMVGQKTVLGADGWGFKARRTGGHEIAGWAPTRDEAIELARKQIDTWEATFGG